MRPGDFKTHAELPEEIRGKYKPVNEKGDFVEKTATEDPEVARRIALLENEAFGELAESIKQSGLSIEEIKTKLDDKKLGYDEQRKLKDLLFQNADLQRLKGSPIDAQIEDLLKKSYTKLQYSTLLRNKLTKGIEPGDVAVIGEILKDEKIQADLQILGKLADDEQSLQAFNICKERVSAACAIIEKVKDVDLALKMYAEVLKTADKNSYSDNSDLESSGRKLANNLFKAGDTRRLVELVESDIFELSYFKDFLHHLGNEPKIIIDLATKSKKVAGIQYALKFVANPELLAQLGAESFSKLSKDDAAKILEYVKMLGQALSAPAETMAMSELNKDELDDVSEKKTAQNKFVVGINRDNKYIIAWSNMKRHKYHRDLFNSLPSTRVQSGGYLGMDEENGKLTIRMERNSGDYGFYSCELLEKNRAAIEKALQEELGDKKFELIISLSSGF